MLIGYKRGQGSIVLRVKILDSSVLTGAGKTGLSSASSGLVIATIADNESSTTSYTGSNLETISTLGTYAAPTSGKARFKEVSSSHPGIYELQIADARFAVSSAKSVLISVSGASGAAECDVVIPLRDLDPYDSVRAGLTALPNAAAEASGGLPTLSAAQASNGTIQANVHRWLTGTPNALQSGRVDGYLGAVASGVIAAASFAANALDAVWSTATRVLTAGTNIALAKGTGVTGFNDLDAAGVRSAVGLASANLDTQLSGINAKTTNLPSDPADASDIAGAFSTVNSTLATIAAYIDTEVATLVTNVATILTRIGVPSSDVATIIAAIKAKTDTLPGSPAAVSDIPTASANAAAVLAAATAAPIAANAKQINDAALTGNGTVSTPWGPA